MRATLLLSVALLTGCAGLARTSFDNNEYDKYVSIYWTAEQLKATCGTPEAPGTFVLLSTLVSNAEAYSNLKGPTGRRITSAAAIVGDLTSELRARYETGTPSKAYCILKLDEIATAAGKIATSLAQKEL